MLRLVVMLMLFGVAASVEARAELSYVGSSTIGEHIIPDAAVAFTKGTGVRFGSVQVQGSGKGLALVGRGEAPLAGVSRALTAGERREGLYYRIVGYDAVTVAVHRDNPVGSFSLDQLKAIYVGRITNWREVGGNAAPIVLITQVWGAGRAQMIEFQTHVLDGSPYRADRKEVDSQHDQVAALSTERHGITAVSRSFLDPGVKVVTIGGYAPEAAHVRSGAYVLSRPLILVAPRRPEPDVKRFIDFVLSAEGQRIVARRFVTVQ
jgi:phosphate transport system substrate-binding protein